MAEGEIPALEGFVGGIHDEDDGCGAEALEGRQGNAEPGLDPQTLVIGGLPIQLIVSGPVLERDQGSERAGGQRRRHGDVDQQDAVLRPARDRARKAARPRGEIVGVAREARGDRREVGAVSTRRRRHPSVHQRTGHAARRRLLGARVVGGDLHASGRRAFEHVQPEPLRVPALGLVHVARTQLQPGLHELVLEPRDVSVVALGPGEARTEVHHPLEVRVDLCGRGKRCRLPERRAQGGARERRRARGEDRQARGRRSSAPQHLPPRQLRLESLHAASPLPPRRTV